MESLVMDRTSLRAEVARLEAEVQILRSRECM
jgi:hypothetical protein